MNLVEKVTSLFGGRRSEPVGVVRVVDRSRLNWLYITYNTVEELVRVDAQGKIRPAAMKAYRWKDGGHTLEIRVREGERFPDGEPLNAASVKRSFDESMRWSAPHPPGTQFNPLPGTTCEVVDERTARLLAAARAGRPPAREATRHPHHEHALLGRDRLRLRPQRHRRGPLVSDRRAGPVGHRTVHPGRRALVARPRASDGPPRAVRLHVAVA